MNRFLKFISLCFTFLLLLIISLYSNSEEVIANSFPFNGLIYADALVMRSEASNSSSKVTEIVYGSRVNVTGESGKFYKVTYDGKAGYILKSYVLNVVLLSAIKLVVYVIVSLFIILNDPYTLLI